MEEGFIASQSRWQSIIVGKSRQQEPAACGHTASTVESRKQWANTACSAQLFLSTLTQSRMPCPGNGSTHSHTASQSRQSLVETPFPGESRFLSSWQLKSNHHTGLPPPSVVLLKHSITAIYVRSVAEVSTADTVWPSKSEILPGIVQTADFLNFTWYTINIFKLA